MNKYIEDAKRFYEKALEELEAGKKDEDGIKIRDAAEKAWNAVLQATDGLIVKRGIEKPTSHHERRRILAELTETDAKIKELGIRERYMAREQSLHEDCFYDGICPLPLLEEDFQKVQRYIEDIENI
jgi:HEPN domain-containing protein